MTSDYRVTGKDGYVNFQGTEVSADYRNFDVELTIDTIEKSVGSEASKSYILNCVTCSGSQLANHAATVSFLFNAFRHSC